MGYLSLACLALIALAIAPGELKADSALTGDQKIQLEAVRTEALAYIGGLPDFLCTQVTTREVLSMDSAGSSPHPVAGDEIEETLTFVGQKEHYQVLTMNGKPAREMEHAKIAGALSTGDFGSALHSIFDPRAKTAFSWDRPATLRGRHVSVFAFQVPLEAGAPISDSRSNKQIVVSYGGRVFVDAETREVLRLMTHFNLPRGFRMTTAEQFVDYRPVEIGGRKYNLPFHSEVRIEEAGFIYVNKIDFKAYRKFEAQSTIRYGAFAEQPASSQSGPLQSSPVAVAAEKTPPSAEPISSAPSSVAQTAQTDAPAPSAPAAEAQAAQSANGESTPAAAVGSAPVAPSPARVAEATSTTNAAPPNPAVDRAADSLSLKVSAELVLVPVVVRDAAGKAVGDLTRDDFELLDKGKRQQITSFSIEGHGKRVEVNKSANGANSSTPVARAYSVVYLFDDIHIKFAELSLVRQAAAQQIDSLPADTEAAILSTSGLVQLPFTVDKGKLHEALLKLRAQPFSSTAKGQCPEVSYYQADQILNVYGEDSSMSPPLQVAIAEAIACLGGADTAGLQGFSRMARNAAVQAARRAQDDGKRESRGALLAIRDVLRWLSSRPGDKNLVMVSPGFIVSTDLLTMEGEVIDQAIGSHVSISTLDERGLINTSPTAEYGNTFGNASAFRDKVDLMHQEAIAMDVVLSDLADGTGGSSVKNNNDLFGALQRLAAPPEFTYVLGFKPEHLKSDGSFHPLTVKMKKGSKLTPQARRGYFAPKQ